MTEKSHNNWPPFSENDENQNEIGPDNSEIDENDFVDCDEDDYENPNDDYEYADRSSTEKTPAKTRQNANSKRRWARPKKASNY